MEHEELALEAKTPAKTFALAAGLTDQEIDVMAHALGWPDTLNVHRPRRRVLWAKPYRNYFAAGGDNVNRWNVLVELGFAALYSNDPGQFPVYVVTDAGKAVTRARLLVHRLLGVKP